MIYRKSWTKDEDEFLIENYPSNGKLYCAEKLNRTERAIIERAKRLKLKITASLRSRLGRKYTKEIIENAVKNSFCISEVCRYFGLFPQSGNYTNFKKLIELYDINTSHFLSGGELTKMRVSNKKQNFNQRPLKEILVINSSYDRSNLKRRLYNEGLKKRECEECGQGEEWRGKKMSLIIDHINGVNNDNRLENLRILCPNCNSTLDTHCKIKEENKRKKLPKISTSRSPDASTLVNDFKELKSFSAVGRKYSVSDNAVRKWCKKLNIMRFVKL